MVNRLLQPQEIETFYIIPTIRSQFAEVLMKNGMKQKQVAEIFGVTTATISQYSSKKRGNEIQFDPQLQKEVEVSAQRITNQHSYIKETQHILQHLRTTKTLCTIHKMFSDVPTNCEPTEMGCTSISEGDVQWKTK